MRDDQADLGVFGKRWAEAELALKLVQFVSIMLYVLVAGVMWEPGCPWHESTTDYDAATFWPTASA